MEEKRLADTLATRRSKAACRETLPFGTDAQSDASLCKPTAQDVAELRALGIAPQLKRLHVLVPGKSARNHLRGVECHVCTSNLPAGSFLRLSENLFVASPELCFLQAAPALPFPALVKLGYDLCSRYARSFDGSTSYDRPLPLTTAHVIEGFLDAVGLRGTAPARKALRYVAECSRSPMETALACALCLPPRHGGYGLPLPCMNYRVDTDRADRGGGAGYRLCDLFWPKARLAVEYDSDLEHTGPQRIAADAARRNALETEGVTVITATRQQVMRPLHLDRLAHQIARRLNVRIRDERLPSLSARARLMESLVA